MDGLPPVLWVRTTCRHSDPPAGMTRGSWLALVLTVKGLVVLAPDDPNVVVHVLGGLGTVATNPTQLAVAETPALGRLEDRCLGADRKHLRALVRENFSHHPHDSLLSTPTRA